MLTPRRAFLRTGAALAAASLAGCGVVLRPRSVTATGSAPAVGEPVSDERQWARTAWRYVENNTDYDTGLVGGMDRVPVFTTWNAADALAAVVCARELGLIDAREFDLRLSRLLGFLGTMELSGGQLPNKAYHAGIGRMVGFDGNPADIGWSAGDVGRLLLWLKIVGQRHPQHAEYADKVVLRWSFCEVIDDCGALFGTARNGGQVQRYQEGRLGYEQLAAAGYAAWGFDTRVSGSWANSRVANVYGLPLRHDARDPRTTGAPSAVFTMPYVLMGLELGFRPPGGNGDVKALADIVYKVQEERWRRERQLTARSDYQTRLPPYIVLDSVFGNGYAWNTIGGDGKEYEQLAMVSTRAVFGMAALWPGEYTQQLVAAVRYLYDPDRGWFEGRMEAGGGPQSNITLSTNAAVLESLAYRAKGPLYAPDARPGFFDIRTADVFQRLNRCTPKERGACKAS
ncbi:MAG: hypothetical protein K0S48_785 [Ramlibacter sp.]|jgi:predicted small lipoprotein YifL|nr:hypothetical protein [Ramlibacter sp.]MCE3273298.1 hypothetical protein [Ramlibacter sp.]